MSELVAHVVREAGQLTEPFIARRMQVQVEGFVAEAWWEQGSPPEGVTAVRVPSRLIRPGTVAARVFHHVPQLGAWQRRAYRDVAATRRPALVHAHYLTTGYLASGTRNAVVIGAYGFDVSVMARRPLWRRAFRALARQGPVILVEGPHMRETVVSLGFPAERVRVVPIAVGHEHLPFTAPDPPGAPGPRLLVAGRFVEKKGIAIAIQALDGLRRRWPAATLEIVGSGRLEGELRAQARSSAAAAAITFLGSLPRALYLERLAEVDLLLAPSLTARNGDSEGGAPTTILDAQAVGTVVVGSTHADIPFLVEEGRTGFLAPANDVEGLVQAIDRALEASDRWREIAAAARSVIAVRHDDASLARGLEEAYTAALDRA